LQVSAYTSTVVIEAPPERVFDFVRTPENQPRWAINFVRSTRPLNGDRYVMETPFGEIAYRIDADSQRRVLDWVLSGENGESILPARVTPHGRGSVFTFTITRAPGASDDDWERGMRGLDEELAVLKRVLETE
jgi:uncharacterized protein YndB with AHSA1/START domain